MGINPGKPGKCTVDIYSYQLCACRRLLRAFEGIWLALGRFRTPSCGNCGALARASQEVFKTWRSTLNGVLLEGKDQNRPWPLDLRSPQKSIRTK